MAIRLKKVSTFRRDVTVYSADGSRGTLTVDYNYFDREALGKLTAEELTDEQLVGRIVNKVGGMLDENDKEYPPEVQMDEVVANLSWSKAVIDYFLEELTGASRKNSKK